MAAATIRVLQPLVPVTAQPVEKRGATAWRGSRKPEN
jgi:hypothetical protein